MLRPARALIGVLFSTFGILACADAGRPIGPDEADAPIARKAVVGTAIPTGTINSQLAGAPCADVWEWSHNDGARVVVYTCNGQENQKFTWQTNGTVTVYDGSKCLDATGGAGNDGDAVIIWSCHYGPNQKWTPTSAGEIRGINDKCLTATGASAGSGLVIQGCDGRAAQKWTLPSSAGTPTTEASTGISDTPTASAPVSDAPPTSNTPSVGVATPQLPQTYLNTALVAPTGSTITVNAGGNLQDAINAARPGDVIVLQAGATFSGNFVLPNKSGSGWVTIRTSTPDGSLPPQGTRITPSRASQMAKIVTPNVMSAIATAPGAHHYRLVGIEVSTASSVSWAYTLVSLGDVGSAQNTLAQVPHDIILDRVYVHGSSTLDLRRCVALNSASTAIIDSWLSDCHARGSDSQAIGGWNGPGPFKIVNNYLEGAGENIMFGGGDPSITNLIPSDIEIRRNHVFKPLSWQGRWTVKNLLELKNSRRVLIEGNVFENNWADAQVGFAILMKSVNQDGSAPWSQTSDVTFQYNIIRRVAAGVSLAGRPESSPAVRMARVRIAHNVFEQLGDAGLGSNFALGRLFQIESTDALEIAHNTGFGTSHALLLVGTPVTAGFVMRDNIIDGGPGITSADGKGMGTESLNYHVPGWSVLGNVIGTSYAPTRTSLLPSGDTYTINGATAGATVRTTDGAAVGADRGTIGTKTAGAVVSQ